MTKVCFIKLKEHWRADPYSDPPLGLLSIMASAKNISFKGKHLDLQLCDMVDEKIIQKADIYALSTCTPDYPELIRITKQIKQEYGGEVIVGGPHFDVLPDYIWKKEIDKLPIDIICRGEGEYTFAQAIKFLEEKNKRDEKKIITQEGFFLDLNSLPFPAREFLNEDLYFKKGKVFGGDTFSDGNSATMMTSRGCPHHCAFCASPIIHNRKIRFRSVENIKTEIEMLKKKYGVSEIRFQDDCFALNLKHLKGLGDMLAETGIKYRCSTRVDQINDQILEELWKSGCREIGFGIESAEDHVLKILKKRTSVTQNREALKKTKEKGFRVRSFFMTGLPGETKDSAQKTIDFLEETKPDVVTLTSFIPLPGCDIYSDPEKYGVTIQDSDWNNYSIYLRLESGAPFVHTVNTITPEDMETNREKLKEYLSNRKMFNIATFNVQYKSNI